MPNEFSDIDREFPPCVQCAYCCTVRPCPYGSWDEENHRCTFLTEDARCSKYEEIVRTAGSEWSPAFGAGCSSSLFNDVRDAKIRMIAKGEAVNEQKPLCECDC
jgi:hypothetical protein